MPGEVRSKLRSQDFCGKHNRLNGRDKSGCNAGWAYLGMLAKIKLLPGQEEGRLAVAGREIAQQ